MGQRAAQCAVVSPAGAHPSCTSSTEQTEPLAEPNLSPTTVQLPGTCSLMQPHAAPCKRSLGVDELQQRRRQLRRLRELKVHVVVVPLHQHRGQRATRMRPSTQAAALSRPSSRRAFAGRYGMPCTTRAARAGVPPRMLAPSCWPPGATHLPRCFRCRRCLAAAALGLGLLLRFLLGTLLNLRQEKWRCACQADDLVA